MVNGGRAAPVIISVPGETDYKVFVGRQHRMKQYDFTAKEYPPLSDVLEAHLRECERCQASLAAKPVPNVVQPHMTRTRLCGRWFDIIQRYAIHEGEVNNIVAETETGALAYKQERLWGYDDDEYPDVSGGGVPSP